VSVPLGWDELASLDSAMHWTVQNIDTRLSAGNQPWATYSSSRHGLATAMRALAFSLKAAAA
jgi:bifunctional non-homologous end joining protein LigD